MEYEPTTRCGSSRYNYQIAVPALLCLIIFNILPVFLIILYPIKVFRRCLSKCKLDSLSLTAFTEKFYYCYRRSCRWKGHEELCWFLLSLEVYIYHSAFIAFIILCSIHFCLYGYILCFFFFSHQQF